MTIIDEIIERVLEDRSPIVLTEKTNYIIEASVTEWHPSDEWEGFIKNKCLDGIDLRHVEHDFIFDRTCKTLIESDDELFDEMAIAYGCEILSGRELERKYKDKLIYKDVGVELQERGEVRVLANGNYIILNYGFDEFWDEYYIKTAKTLYTALKEKLYEEFFGDVD